jgi:hypothetical protein
MNDELLRWLAAGFMALALAGSMVLDGPTETQAAQDVADEVAALESGK